MAGSGVFGNIGRPIVTFRDKASALHVPADGWPSIGSPVIAMPEQLRILVVDDDKGIRNMLRRYLCDEGFAICEAQDGVQARAVFKREKIDLVLLDLTMPGEDGLSVARHIRQHSDVPIIMLTGKGELIDRVVGLEAGADDYIPKPFHLREILARIRSVMRRSRPVEKVLESEESKSSEKSSLAFQGWRLDLLKRELCAADGSPVPLTTAEFELLRVLAQHPNRVLNRDQLMDFLKGREWAAYDRTIDTQVVRLRRKVERDPKRPELIKTVRGAGYIFAAEVDAD
jgi:two-component system, OmpR family, response regulator